MRAACAAGELTCCPVPACLLASLPLLNMQCACACCHLCATCMHACRASLPVVPSLPPACTLMPRMLCPMLCPCQVGQPAGRHPRRILGPADSKGWCALHQMNLTSYWLAGVLQSYSCTCAGACRHSCKPGTAACSTNPQQLSSGCRAVFPPNPQWRARC